MSFSKRLILFVLLFFITCRFYSIEQADTTIIRLKLEKALTYKGDKKDSSIILLQDAEAFAVDKNLISEAIKLLVVQGNILYSMNLKDSCRNIYLKAIQMAPENKKYLAVEPLYRLSFFYENQGQYNKALEYILQAEKLISKDVVPTNCGRVYWCKGNVLMKLGKHDDAFKDFERSLEWYKKSGNELLVGDALANLGVLNFNLKKYRESLNFLRNANIIFVRANNSGGISSSLINMGNVYSSLKLFDSSLACIKAALPYKIRVGSPKGIGMVYLNLGAVYSSMKRIADALQAFDQALIYAQQSGSLDLKREIYYNLYDLYFAEKKFEKAIYHLEKYYEIKDSMFNKETSQQINELQTLYESEKKDNEIKMLNQQNDAHKKEIELSDRVRIFLIIIVALVALMAIGAIYAFINKSKDNKIIIEQKKEVEEKKALIEEKNKEVMDSIHYAKRIQKALITSELYIGRNLEKLRKN